MSKENFLVKENSILILYFQNMSLLPLFFKNVLTK